MKSIYIILVCLTASAVSLAQPQFELSRNVYRIPYSSGTDVRVSNDHYTHSPVGRYDLVGRGNGSSCGTNYPIVAAAEGIIRRIEDDFNVHGPDCSQNCSSFNNYVWIEHANGEWTKYSHMKQNSTTGTAGLSVGDTVCAGQLLGYECEIGQASGPHLHWEVRHPNDPGNVQISTAGGFMDDADHYIAVINSLPKHFFQDSDEVVASGSSTCTSTDVNVIIPFSISNSGIRIYMATNTIINSPNVGVQFNNGSNGLFHAGNSVTLSPGFTASSGSYFNARIGSCVTTNFPGNCN